MAVSFASKNLRLVFIILLLSIYSSAALKLAFWEDLFGGASNVDVESTTLPKVFSKLQPPEPLPSLSYRRQLILNMTKEAWNAYRRHAWGAELVRPLTLATFEGHLASSGGTIVAAMSTLWIMNLTEEFEAGRSWIQESLDLSDLAQEGLPMHVIVNHHIGALLSCYALTGDVFFLDKAIEVDRSIRPSRHFPTVWSRTKLSSRTNPAPVLDEWAHQVLEYRYLSKLTASGKYHQRVVKIEQFLKKLANKFGVDLRRLDTVNEGNHLMAKVKSYLQSGDTTSLDAFNQAIHKAKDSGRIKHFPVLNLTYIQQFSKRSKLRHYRDCSLGGMFALASRALVFEKSKVNPTQLTWSRYLLELAENITSTCATVARQTATRLVPFQFYAKHNQLVIPTFPPAYRGFHLDPQLAESYYILYRVTGKEQYRVYAWELVKAIQEHCHVGGNRGYTAVGNVQQNPPQQQDYQKPVFLGATLKYLWLIFAEDGDDRFPLDRWIFNGVGQPLPMLGRGKVID